MRASRPTRRAASRSAASARRSAPSWRGAARCAALRGTVLHCCVGCGFSGAVTTHAGQGGGGRSACFAGWLGGRHWERVAVQERAGRAAQRPAAGAKRQTAAGLCRPAGVRQRHIRQLGAQQALSRLEPLGGPAAGQQGWQGRLAWHLQPWPAQLAAREAAASAPGEQLRRAEGGSGSSRPGPQLSCRACSLPRRWLRRSWNARRADSQPRRPCPAGAAGLEAAGSSWFRARVPGPSSQAWARASCAGMGPNPLPLLQLQQAPCPLPPGPPWPPCRLTNSLMMHGRNNGKKLMAVKIVSVLSNLLRNTIRDPVCNHGKKLVAVKIVNMRGAVAAV